MIWVLLALDVFFLIAIAALFAGYDKLVENYYSLGELIGKLQDKKPALK